MPTSDPQVPALRPRVIIDFTVDDGLLSIHLKNIGDGSAYAVKTTFDRPFTGLAGAKRISEMRVFRRVDFMPPGKEFTQFVDSLSEYKRRGEPMRLVATIAYRDDADNRYEERIPHDLKIYLDLGQAKPVRKPTRGG